MELYNADAWLAMAREGLAELNQEKAVGNLSATAFYVGYDHELEGYVAHVIFVVDDGDIQSNLEVLDEYCAAAGDKLEQRGIVFTYCIYRTRQEYTEDFGTVEWENVLYEVDNVVEFA